MSSIFTKSFLILLKAVKAARGGKYVHREFAGTFTDKKGKIRNKWHYFRNQGTLQQELAAWKAKFEAKQAKQKRNLFATPADIKGVEQTKPIRNEKLADRKKRIAKVLANPVALESAKQETLKLIQQHREIKEQPKQTSVARFNDSGVKFRESSVKGLYDARNPHNDKEIFVIYERPNGYELKFGSESKGIFTDLKSLNDAIKTKVQDTKDILDMLERETPTSPKVEPVQAKTFDEHIAHLNLSDSQKKAALDLLNSLKKDTPEFAKTRIERFKTMPGSYRAVGEAVASYFEQGNSLSDAMLGNQNAKKDVVAELNPESEVKKYSNGISIKTITKDGKVYRKLKLSNLNKSFDMDERVRKLILSGDLKRISNSLNKNKFSKNEFVIPESSYENVINGLGIVEKKNKADQPKEELSIDDKRVVSLEKEFDKDIDSGMDSISLFNKFKDKANVIKVVYSEKVNRYGLDLFTKDDPDYGIGFIQMVPSKLKDFLSKNYPAQYNQLQNYLDNPNKDLMHIGIVKNNFETMPESESKDNFETMPEGKAEPTDNYFKINSEGKMELHFDKQKYKNLSDDQKREIKRSFLFSPSRGAWVSRSKYSQRDNTSLAQKLGLEESGKEKKLTFQEEIDLKKQRAGNRVEKFEYKSDKAVKNAEVLQSAFNRLRKDWSWLTQPINDTAGGRAFGRSRQRVINQYSKGFEEYDKARYYDTRAQIAKDTANDVNLKRPLYLQNRIKDAEKSIRAINKWVSEYETEMNNPSTDETRKEKIVTWLEDGLEKLKYNYDKLAYYQVALENLKESSGETVYTKDVMKEMGKNIKTHFKQLGLKDVKVNSSNRYMSVSMRPELPKDFRYEVGKFAYPEYPNDPNEPRNVGGIMPTYITLTPKDWDRYFKTKGKDIVNGDDSIAQKSNILTLLKGKKAQEGEVRTWGNNKQYKKVGGKWQPVNEGKKKAEPKAKKERKKKGSTESNTGFSMKPFAEIKRIAQYTKEADFDKEKIEQYKNSIAEHGYDPAFPMVIDKDKKTGAYNVVAGNHRYKAVEALISEGKLPKDFEIPTVMREFEDENARLAYQVRENQRRDPLPTDEANAYKKMADNGWDAARIAKELGQPVGKITKRLALSNLSPDLFNLVSKKGIPVGIAEAIGLGSVEEESGKPNHTIQLKAYQFYRDNKGKGYGAGEVLSFIRELKSNASQKFFENDGKSDTEKEALRSVGSEEKAKRNVKMLDNTFKSISKALSNLMGDSVGQINPKLAKELSASIVAAQGESEFGIKMKQLDTVIQDMQLMKEAFMKSFKGMKDDSTMGMMFASSINTMIHHVNKHTKAIETAKAINKMLTMAYKAKYKLHDQSVKARLAA